MKFMQKIGMPKNNIMQKFKAFFAISLFVKLLELKMCSLEPRDFRYANGIMIRTPVAYIR